MKAVSSLLFSSLVVAALALVSRPAFAQAADRDGGGGDNGGGGDIGDPDRTAALDAFRAALDDFVTRAASAIEQGATLTDEDGNPTQAARRVEGALRWLETSRRWLLEEAAAKIGVAKTQEEVRGVTADLAFKFWERVLTFVDILDEVRTASGCTLEVKTLITENIFAPPTGGPPFTYRIDAVASWTGAVPPLWMLRYLQADVKSPFPGAHAHIFDGVIEGDPQPFISALASGRVSLDPTFEFEGRGDLLSSTAHFLVVADDTHPGSCLVVRFDEFDSRIPRK